MENFTNQMPGMRQMLDSNPQAREMLSNPELLRQMFDPSNMQALLQMQSAMAQLQVLPISFHQLTIKLILI